MKLVIFADVHGNLPALQTVTERIRREGYDAVIHLGDAIGIGPYPAECLDELLALPNFHSVMGNHDAWFAHGLPDPLPPSMRAGEAAHHRWTHRQLNPAQRTAIAQWPYVIQRNFDGVSMSFFHYALDASGHDFAPIQRNPSAGDLDALFAPYRADLICFGHHHPFCDVSSRTRYINPGSLGCQAAAVAPYAIVMCRPESFAVEHCRLPYDDSPLFAAFEQRDVPERKFLYRAFFGGRFV